MRACFSNCSGVGGSTQTRGFSLLEVLTVIGIIVVLAAMLFPTMQTIQARTDSVACQQNLKKIGQGMLQYAADNEGYFPPHWGNEGPGPTLTWYGFVAPYVSDWDRDINRPMSKEFFCPLVLEGNRNGQTYESTSANAVGMSYGYNYFQLTRNVGGQMASKSFAMNTPAKVVMVSDIPVITSAETKVNLPGFMGQYMIYPAEATLSERHPGGTCNMVFADGHVESRNARKMADPDREFHPGNWDPNY